MKELDRPGKLGPLLGDQTIELPDHLSWDVLGDNIVPPKKKNRRPWWILPLLVGILALAGLRFSMDRPAVSFAEPDDPVISSKAETLATLKSEKTLTSDVSTSSTPQLANLMNEYVSSANQESRISGLQISNSEELATISEANTELVEIVNGTTAGTLPNKSTGTPQTGLLEQAPATLKSIPTLDYRLTVNRNSPSPMVSSPPAKPIVLKSIGQNQLVTAAGVSLPANLPAELDPLHDLSATLRWQRSLNRGWRFSTGLQLNQTAWRSRLDKDESSRLYRPGTVDTIYRNLTTGEERVVTRDSVNGRIVTRFTGYGRVTTLGIPLLLGRSWSLAGGRLGVDAGISPAFVIQRRGLTLLPNDEITELGTNGVATQNFVIPLSARLNYSYPIGQVLRLFGEAGIDWSTTKLFTLSPATGRVHYNLSLGIGLKL